MDNLFSDLQNIRNLNAVSSNDNSFPAGLSQNDLKVLEILENLTNNDTLSGVISEIKGDTVTIILNNNTTVNANLNADINLNVGSMVVFEINKDKSSNTIALRPLFTNVSQENLSKAALKEAEVPLNDKSLMMLASMMEKGMPIDKESISSLYRNVVNFPEYPINEIVTAKSINLPITAQNLEKFDAVINFESKISDSVSSLIEDIANQFDNFDTDDNGFLKNFSDALFDEADFSKGEISKGDTQILSTFNENEKEAEINDNISESVSKEKTSDLPENIDVFKEAYSFLKDETDDIPLKEGHSSLKFADTQIAKTDEILDKAFKILGDKDIPFETKKDIVKSDIFKNAIKDKLSKEWLMEPKDFSDEKSLNEHYEKIIQTCDRLTKALASEPGINDNVSQSINNFRENLNFLDNLNNLAPYIQIPMKMGNEANTGDLYVYAKKKNLLEEKDNLSALLRLDMKYLGALEVYVRLTGSKNVSTDFTFEDEESLKLVEKNIHILNERLENTGYKITNSFSTKKNAPPIFEDLPRIRKDEGEIINLYKFDVRA